ncbi:MAG: hypothetical protein K0R29_1570 [Pseudobdellovibrio sp.]|jgi:signal peptidase I|nr:hypothetical protein [Pseudobdellovibrio sp.]
MSLIRKKIGKQGTWASALSLLFVPILVLFAFRWLIYEPFVIPSGSMEPTLKIHDHILVKKYSYGVRLPFGEGWLLNFSQPQRGDIIVFRYPENKKVFFIKRVIGIPGDKIEVHGGSITVNGEFWPYRAASADDVDENDPQFRYFVETSGGTEFHFIKFGAGPDRVKPEVEKFEVPKNSYFVMGDNRDQSRDSRFWGFVDHSLVVGKATVVWLSCERTLETAPMICDPSKIRPLRVFKGVH